jgi:protein-disulfide isomerase
MKKTEPKKGGGTMPLIIIVGVLVAVVAGGWVVMNNSSKRPPARNTNANARQTATPDMSKAPLGAQPPNMLGSQNALVTVEEFADFQCPTCATTHPAMKEIQSAYGSKIKFIFRNFPLTMHDKAYEAATAAEAAGLQGSQNFWAMQNLLFTNQRSWSADPNYRQVFTGYAQQLGLNVEKFQTDMAGLTAKTRVDADLARGRAINVNSTPSVYINGRSIPLQEMNANSMRQIIDAELQAAASKASAPANSAPAGK